jgi:hypothetical protein
MPLPEYIPLNWDIAPAGPETDIHFIFTGKVWEAQSLTCPEILHRVNLIGDHGVCTCEDFRYRTTKTGKPCKHLRSLYLQARGKL